ncbi:MAG: nucleotidyltransferase family protein [Patescibacteria group bacterium]
MKEKKEIKKELKKDSIVIIQKVKKQIAPILKRQGVIKAAFFGSFARGEIKKTSDIDLLIDLKKGKTLLDVAHLKLNLEQMLGKKVDLVEYGAIHPFFRDIVLKEQKLIYEE